MREAAKRDFAVMKPKSQPNTVPHHKSAAENGYNSPAARDDTSVSIDSNIGIARIRDVSMGSEEHMILFR